MENKDIGISCDLCGKRRRVLARMLHPYQLAAINNHSSCYCQKCDPSAPGRPNGVYVWAKEWFAIIPAAADRK